jgi:hypothetical protein
VKITEIAFMEGYRKDAVERAIEIVRKSGRPAELIICRDIPGHHTGGEQCFCDPKTLIIEPED